MFSSHIYTKSLQLTEFLKSPSGIQCLLFVTPILKGFMSVRLLRQALSMTVHFTCLERGHRLDDAISLHAAYMTTGSLYFYFMYEPYKAVVNRISCQSHVSLLAGWGVIKRRQKSSITAFLAKIRILLLPSQGQEV